MQAIDLWISNIDDVMPFEIRDNRIILRIRMSKNQIQYANNTFKALVEREAPDLVSQEARVWKIIK